MTTTDILNSPTSSPTSIDQHLIFIVGSPRSGTTYLQRLISTLPNIKSGPETHLFDHVGPCMDLWHAYATTIAQDPDYIAVGLPLYHTTEQFTEIMRNLVSELMQPMIGGLKAGEFFLEKSPTHSLHLHTIRQLLPAAPIIHLLRDPRDVVASLLAISRQPSGKWAPKQVDQCAQLWCDFVNHIKDTVPSIPPEQFFELKYEALLEDPTDSLQSIAKFLNMDWSQDTIQTAVAANSIAATRAKFGLNEVRRGSANGWRQDLTPWQKFRVWQIARSTMASVGYDWRFPW